MDNNNTEWRETPAMMLQGLLRNRLKFKFFNFVTFFEWTSDMAPIISEECLKIPRKAVVRMNIGLDSDHHLENLPVLAKTMISKTIIVLCTSWTVNTTFWLEIVRVAVELELESDKREVNMKYQADFRFESNSISKEQSKPLYLNRSQTAFQQIHWIGGLGSLSGKLW